MRLGDWARRSFLFGRMGGDDGGERVYKARQVGADMERHRVYTYITRAHITRALIGVRAGKAWAG